MPFLKVILFKIYKLPLRVFIFQTKKTNPIFKINSFGFTLIELLVALMIVGIVAAAATPNLRKFSREQELDSVTNQVIQAIRQTQSNALSNIQCSKLYPAKSWAISIGDSDATGKRTYVVSGECFDLNALVTPAPISYPVYFLSNNITYDSTNSTCSSAPTNLIFRGTDVFYQCPGDVVDTKVTGSGVKIALKNTLNNNSSIITITNAGIVTKTP